MTTRPRMLPFFGVMIAATLLSVGCSPATNSAPPAAPAKNAASTALAAMSTIVPNVSPDLVSDAPIDGFQQLVIDGRVAYVSDDGKYLIDGRIMEIAGRRDLTDAAIAPVRKAQLDQIPAKDRIVFAPETVKYTVTVFTDVECGYCRKFHDEIQAYNNLGIAVEYLAFPRQGIGSADYAKMEAVWCAPDRRAALTAAKRDKPVTVAPCAENPVAREYQAGRKAGLTGTPMIIAKDGTLLGGYLPPEELRAALDRQAAALLARS